MNEQLRQAILTDAYHDVEDLIHKLVWRIHKTYGLEIDELLCEANFIFTLNFDYHDEELSSFSTWMYNQIHLRLLSYARNQNYKAKTRKTNYKEDSQRISDIQSQSERLLMDLDDDAKLVVNLILHPPPELESDWQEFLGSPKDVKNCLEEHLKFCLKWNGNRISKTFAEITEALDAKD